MGRIIFFIIFFVLCLTENLFSTLTIMKMDTANYPEVKCKFFFTDDWNRVQLGEVQNGNAEFYDNSVLMANQYTNASIAADTAAILICFDLGLGNRYDNFEYLSYAKQLTTQFISYVNAPAQVGFLSFTLIPIMDHNFTTEYVSVCGSVENLLQGASSEISKGLLGEQGGINTLAQQKAPFKSILLVTHNVINFADVELIIDAAKRNNITINILYLSSFAPDNIVRIADETGGYILTETDIQQNSLSYLASLACVSSGGKPNEFTANFVNNCSGEHVCEIRTSFWGNAHRNILLDAHRLTHITAEPDALNYPSVYPGTTDIKEVKIKANFSDCHIYSIAVDNPLFKIESGLDGIPKILNKDSIITLSISYSPNDSSISFARLLIESDACKYDTLYLTGGYPNVPPREKTIHIIEPKSNDVLVVGDTVNVKWVGVLPKDVVSLVKQHKDENNVIEIDTFARNILGLSRQYLVPAKDTSSVKMVINQMWPNNVGRTLDFPHDASVRYASFNALEDKIITVSNKKVRIWNSNNADLLFTFPEFRDTVSQAFFFSDKGSVVDKYVVVSCYDSCVYVYNADNNLLLWKHKVPERFVYSVDVSKDGEYMVVNYGNDKLDLVSMKSGIKLSTLERKGVMFKSVRFHPQKNELMAVSFWDGIIRFYEISDEKLVHSDSINVKPQGVGTINSTYATYNYDGSLICMANWTMYEATLIDRKQHTTLAHLRHGDNKSFIIRHVSFLHTATEDYVITACDDKTLKRWNLDGTPSVVPNVFIEHKGAINTGVFNSDGWRLLSASSDSLVKIWNLNQKTLQTDTTSELAVDFAKIRISDTLDFGDAYVGQMKVRTFNQELINLKKFPFRILSMRIIGTDAADFNMLDETEFPDTIRAEEQRSLSFIFQPTSYGDRYATLRIIIPNDTIDVVLHGIGINIGLQPLLAFIDFGKVFVDDYKDMELPVAVNVSEDTIIAERFIISGVDSASFRYYTDGADFVLLPNDTIKIALRFIPFTKEQKIATLLLRHSYSEYPLRWNLNGVGTEIMEDTLAVEIKDFSAYVGDTVDVPIFTNNLTKNPSNKSGDRISIVLQYNSSMLYPKTFGNEVVIEKYEHNRHLASLTLSLPYKAGSQIIQGLQFVALLGDANFSEINILNAYSPINTQRLNILPYTATYTLFDTADTRRFDEYGKIILKQNQPNPAENTTSITFELPNAADILLELYDYSGTLLQTLINEHKVAGRHSVVLDMKTIPAGAYYYTLQTGKQTLTKALIRK